MNLTTQVERWRAYWLRANDLRDVERRLYWLRWLEDFAFHCGNAIGALEFRALQQQIEAGEAKLAALRGEVRKAASPDALQTAETTPPAGASG